MKLVPLILLTSLSVGVRAQKFRQEQFPLPPQFQNSFPGFFSTDSSLYLPPESNAPLPYFPMKNMNLPYPYLPPTGTKAPSTYPTPYPFLISTSLVPNFDNDDDDEDEGRIQMSSPNPQPAQHKNRTDQKYGPQQFNNQYNERRDMRELKATPRMNFANFPNPIDRIDMKLPSNFGHPSSTTQAPSNQTPPGPKRMIIDNRNDGGLDQIKAASYQGPSFLHAGPGPIFVSSTTEPAIPILRLSNEMDLDGSFSYEALGADQTHYMQHSRMENMGTDKEEQVVEGSYSYVGDNGQTYTVHYVADSNGFRASGEHLPVAPPVPEIIQRAVQYNLAEEAKKPPHLRNNWQDDGRDTEISNNNERQPQFVPPPRNLFTGRTPEAFSYSYSQGSNTQNNLVAAESSQVPVKTQYTTEQSKVKPSNGPIKPQITFLASQGAHVPSLNSVQNTISRMFTTEKSSMPQLFNYEAGVKDQDQESSKALWRWQYGINANTLSQNQNKDTISRSIGEHDEVMINFNDMTPEQYRQMMQSQQQQISENVEFAQYTQNPQANYLNKNSYPTKNKLNPQNFQGQYTHNHAVDQNNYHNQPIPIFKNHQNNQNHNMNAYQTTNTDAIPQNGFDVKSEQKQQQQPVSSFNNYQQEQKTIEATVPIPSLNNYQQEQRPIKATVPVSSFNNYQQEQRTIEATVYHSSTEPTLDYKSTEESHQAYDVNNNKQSYTSMTPVVSREISFDARPKLVTHKDFVFPTQSHTVTQDYNFEDDFYEPRKIKSLNKDSAVKYQPTNHNQLTDTNFKQVTDHLNNLHLNDLQNNEDTNSTPMPKYEKAVTPNMWPSTYDYDTFTKTTQIPISTLGAHTGLRFTDFIVKEEETKHDFANSDFKPIITEAPRQIETTTTSTTESSMEEIIQNNIFLKNLLNHQKSHDKEKKIEMNITEEPKRIMPLTNKLHAAPKTEKPIIFIQSQSKPANELKVPKKKHVDIADILNYVSMKNHFELNKTKPKGKQTRNNVDQMTEIRLIPLQQDKHKENGFQENNFSQPNTYRTLNHEQQEELKGIIRNYKVLQRNNNSVNKYDSNPIRTDLSPPPLKPLSLPPLGRAGPSMKSYLPPIYV